jgi:hypothetical protein
MQEAMIGGFGRSVGAAKKSKVVSKIAFKLFVKKEAFCCRYSPKTMVRFWGDV